jgi:hypothetical protein
MTNAKYLQTFKGLVDEIEHLDREIGVDEKHVQLYLDDNLLGGNDEDDYERAKQLSVTNI